MGNSYIPLYRKYRPQKFCDLIGQEAISRTLGNAIELNKVAHAYLFTGPRGTGKTSSARIFAKSLNCQNGPTLDPCGVCPSCIDIAAGNAIDVIEIDAASNRKVEDARNLLEKVQFVPVAGKYKIYIIDEVHMLTTEAFNTLLKTLEEPPANLIFILATTESHKVLNTIISRCQRFDFRRIRQDLIVKRLQEICKTENLNIEEKALNLIARKSSGGMRDALSMLDQVSILTTMKDVVTDKDILNLLGNLQEDVLLKLVESLADKNPSDLLTVVNEITEAGSEPVQVIRELTSYFRNLMLIKTSDNLDEIKQLIDVSDNFYKELQSQSEKFDPAEIPQIIEKLSEHERTLKTSSQQHLWLEVALISILHRQDIKVIKDLEERITKLETIISSGNIQINQSKPAPQIQPIKPVQVQTPVSAPPKPKTIIEPTETPQEKEPPKNPQEPVKPISLDSEINSVDIISQWSNLLGNIDSIPTRTLFSDQARPVEINSEKIILNFINEIYLKTAQGKTKIAPFEKAAEKIFGTVPKIIFKQGSAEEMRRDYTKPTVSQTIISSPEKTEQPAPQNIIQSAPAKTENVEQISHNLEEVAKKQNEAIVISEVQDDFPEEDIIEDITTSEEKMPQVTLPETAKMVKDLFQGKVIE